MAPNSEVVLNRQYHNAVHSLMVACQDLEGHLPPIDNQEEIQLPDAPPLWPRARVDSVAACTECAAELEALDEGDRSGHVCNHGRDETADSRSAEQVGPRRTTFTWKHQPNIRILKRDVDRVDSCFLEFTTALSNLSTLLEEEEYRNYEEHLLVWATSASTLY